jgi:formate hydrogenlyase subunit 6/NADH:ubiquinone oxidoreductase subunit I
MTSTRQTSLDTAISRRGLFRAAVVQRNEVGARGRVTIAELCFARRGIGCRSCEDVCEPRALRFRPRPGGMFVPEINSETCTACGECATVCPAAAISTPEGAT